MRARDKIACASISTVSKHVITSSLDELPHHLLRQNFSRETLIHECKEVGLHLLLRQRLSTVEALCQAPRVFNSLTSILGVILRSDDDRAPEFFADESEL